VYFAASHLVRRRSGIDPTDSGYAFKPPEERFRLTQDLLRDSCLAFCQTTAQGLDERIGIKRVGEERTHPVPLGDYEPSFGVLLRDRAKRFGDKVYVRYRIGDQETAITWTEFADRTFQIARHLMELGIHPGDRIGMISENRVEMLMVDLAAMSIGAVVTPIFAGYLPPQIAYVLRQSRPRFVVVSGHHQLQKIERARHPWVEKYFCMDFDAASADWGAIDLTTLTGEGGVSAGRLEKRVDGVRPDHLCMVMYTSGTTGPPKGVCLCHRNLISQQKALSLIWDVTLDDVFMSYLPWHHSFGGLFERFQTLYTGAEFCLDDSRGRDIDRLIENWKAFNPSIFLSVPRVHDMLLARCREDPSVADMVFGGRLRFVFTAGAPLPSHVEAIYRARNIPVLEGWGLTETSPCVTATTKEHAWKSGFVGFPMPGISVRIDSDNEILVKGPCVMEGYFDDEETTSHVIDKDGWFHSGDLGEFTKDGLRLFGRKDGTFKLTTGEKVHPLRIENTLINESTYISQALVIGSGKDFVGALVYPDFGQLRAWAARRGLPDDKLTEHPAVRDLYACELQRVNQQIEIKFHRVRRVVLADREPSLANGELTPSAKLVRKAIMNNYKKKIEALFAAQPSEDVIEVVQQELQRTSASAK
jgi:long-subunit acyl-CoA synthetase (AMP-forming)